MTVHHHIEDELLVAYAAGDLPEAVALFVAAHAALCAECRSTIIRWEDVGGEVIADLEGTNLSDLALATVLDRLDDSRPVTAEHRPAQPGILPLPVLDYAGGPIDDLRWKRILPGVLQADLDISHEGIPVRINRLSSFVRIPLHTHRAPEYTLILSGGLHDEHGVYERGDVHVYDAQHRHAQRVLPGEPCVCLVINSDRLVPLTLLGRVLGKLTGI